MSKPLALVVSELHQHFARGAETIEILRGISFSVAAGQSLAIIGPSGSGKSTLLHVIGTLETPSAGQISIGGQNPLDLSEPELAHFRNLQIGFVFQNHHLLPQYSALENALIPTLASEQVDRTRRRSDRAPAAPPGRTLRRGMPARRRCSRSYQPTWSLAL